MQKALNQLSISFKIIGATSMSEPEEQVEIESLEKERKLLQRSTIKIAKASFNIMYFNNNEEDQELNVDEYKQMIYKTINANGYFINEVTREKETMKYIQISITMLQEQTKLINTLMIKERIEYTSYNEEIIETSMEEIEEIMTHMRDKQLIWIEIIFLNRRTNVVIKIH